MTAVVAGAAHLQDLARGPDDQASSLAEHFFWNARLFVRVKPATGPPSQVRQAVAACERKRTVEVRRNHCRKRKALLQEELLWIKAQYIGNFSLGTITLNLVR